MSSSNLFQPYINKGYSIDIQLINNSFANAQYYHLIIKWYNTFVFEAYWIAYPSDDLLLSIIREHHRNEMLNRLLKPERVTKFV